MRKKPKVNTKNKYNYGKEVERRQVEIENHPINCSIIKILTKKWLDEKINNTVAIILCVAYAICMLLFLHQCTNSFTSNNRVQNSYQHVLNRMPKEPKDITQVPYEAKIPKTIQKDINKMMKLGKDADIIYYSNNCAILIEQKEEESEQPYYVQLQERGDDGKFYVVANLDSEISFYKSNKKIVIYGRENNNHYISKYTIGDDHIEEGYLEFSNIERSYTEVLKELENEPKDITAIPYQENMPAIIQKDIEKMLAIGHDCQVKYYSDDKSCEMKIAQTGNAEKPYEIFFIDNKDRYSINSLYGINENLSFYKSGDTLVAYGCASNRRYIQRYFLNNEEADNEYLDKEDIDLYGVDEEFDEIRDLNTNATVVQKENTFAIYRLGEKISETVFDEGEIESWTYDYLMTKEGTCYNVYYSTNLDNPWIKFVKVAESVEEVLDETINIRDDNDYTIKYRLLQIDGKKYAQIPDTTTERAYGQNYGWNHEKDSKGMKLNFQSKLVEIDPKNTQKIELRWMHYGIGNDDEWLIRYYFGEAYIERRVNGIDGKLTDLIPEDELKKFDGKVISLDKVQETIRDLQDLYNSYTKNDFTALTSNEF